MDIQSLYSTLLTATFGGVPFNVIDTSQETGRRVQRFVFPGIDDASYQDLGADDGPISIKGILVGDDYIAQSRALRAVFRSAGPYNLVHPWLGNFQVILAQRPRITLAATELRVARFEVQVYPFVPEAQPGLNTLQQLETAVDQLTADVKNAMASVLSPLVDVLGAFSYAQSWAAGVSQVFTSAMGASPSFSVLLGAAQPFLAALAAPTSAPNPAWAPALAGQLVAVPVAIAQAAAPLVPAAVAPGGSLTAPAAADAGDAVATLLAAVPGIAATAANPGPGPALAAAMQAVVVGQAVQAASGIAYDSQQDAQAQGAVLYAALDAAIFAAATAAQTDPANAAPVWRDLVGLKAALAADLNALIGRLPEVVVITTTNVMPAWLLAMYVAGDELDQVYATYRDIVVRNKVFHPALVPAGGVEVLNS